MSDVDEAVAAWLSDQRAARAAAIPQENDNPEKAARAFQLGQITGLPSSGIYGDLPTFERNYKGGLIQDFLSTNPKLMTFANSHPMAPKIAQDDWHKLDQASESMDKLFAPSISGMAAEQEASVRGISFNAPLTVLGNMVKGFKVGHDEGGPVGQQTEDFLNYLSGTPFGALLPTWHPISKGLVFAGEEALRVMQGALYASAEGIASSAQELGMSEADVNRLRRDVVVGLMVAMSGQGEFAPGLHTGTKTTLGVREEAARLSEITGKSGFIAEEITGKTEGLAEKFGPEFVENWEKMHPDDVKALADVAAQGPEAIEAVKQAQKIGNVIRKVEPYLRSGEPIPPGLDAEIDKVLAEVAERDAKNLDKAVKDSAATATRERSPDLFATFGRIHSEGEIGISVDAIRKLYGGKEPAPEDNILGWIPDLGDKLRSAEATGGYVKVSAADWLAKVDKEVHDALLDDIQVRQDGVSVNESKMMDENRKVLEEYEGKEPTGKVFAQREDPVEEALRQIREALDPTQFRQVPYGVSSEWVRSLSEADYGRLLEGTLEIPENVRENLEGPARAGQRFSTAVESVRESAGLRRKEGKVGLRRLPRPEDKPIGPQSIEGMEWIPRRGGFVLDRPEDHVPGQTPGYALISKTVDGQWHVQVDDFEVGPLRDLEEAKRVAEEQVKNPADAPSGQHDFVIEQGGKDIGSIIISETEGGKNLYVNYVHAWGVGGPRTLGPRAMWQIREMLREEFPNAETISGDRVTGARALVGKIGLTKVRLDTGSPDAIMDLIRSAQAKVEGQMGKWVSVSPGLALRMKSKLLPKEEALANEVKTVLDRILPQGKYKVAGAEEIRVEGTKALGAYDEFEDQVPLIAYVLSLKDPIGTAKHEAIHFLRSNGFFTEEQWATLEKAAVDEDWMGKHNIHRRYPGASRGLKLEEAIAEEFKNWHGRPDETHRAAKVFKYLEEMVKLIKQAVEKIFGYELSANDIFTMVETGDIARQKSSGPMYETSFDVRTKAQKPELERPFEKKGLPGFTEEQSKRWLKRIEEQRADDVEAQVKKVRGEIEKRQTAEWKENEARISAQVRDELKSRPDYQVDAFLNEGKLGDEKLKAMPTLDSTKLSEAQKKQIPQRLQSKSGIDPTAVANYFGYQTAEQMLNRHELLVNARKRMGKGPGEYFDHVVKQQTEARMEREYGDLDENILREAKEHVVSDTQIDLLHDDILRMGMEAESEIPIKREELEAWVDKAFAARDVKASSVDTFLKDAGRAGRAAEIALLKDDAITGYKQKQRQIQAMMMAQRAVKLEKQMDRFETLAKRFKARQIENIPQEYTNFIHDILMRVMPPGWVRRTVQDLDREIGEGVYRDLGEFVDKKNEDGFEMPVAEFLFDRSYRKPLKDMKVEEFQALADSIKTMAKRGRDEGKFIKEGEARDLDSLKQSLISALERLGEVKIPKGVRGRFQPFRTANAALLQIEALFNRFDLDDPRGPWNRYGILPLADAANYKAQLEKQIARKLREIPKSKTDLNEVIHNPGVFIDPWSTKKDKNGQPIWEQGGTPSIITRKDLRGIMMYLGRQEGRDKLVSGHGVDIDNVMNWVDKHATKEDWDYVQKIGDIYEDLKELADRMYRRMTGVAPESSTLLPIDTRHGPYKGWYAPIRYDKSFKGTSKKEGILDQDYTKATIPAGYTKKVTGYKGVLSFDIDEIPAHAMSMVHDIAFREAFTEASKIFLDPAIKNAMTKHYGLAYSNLLEPFIRDVANSSSYMSAAQQTGAKVSQYFRANMIATLIGFNPGTVMKHGPTAFMNSVTEVGVKEFSQAFADMFSRNEATGESNWRFVKENSAEIQRRDRNYRETFRGAQEDVLQEDTWRNRMIKVGAMPVAWSDLVSAVPTWLAQYRKSIAEGLDHGEAVGMGDRAVRRAHGSTAITNRPALMRAGEPVQWFASLYGFFNHMYNRQFELAWKANESWKGIKEGDMTQLKKYQKDLVTGLWSYLVFPAIVEEVVSPIVSEDHSNMGVRAFKALGREVFNTIPILRDFASLVVDGGRHETSIGMFTPMAKSIADFAKDIHRGPESIDRQHAGSTVQHAVTMLGAMTGMAPAQFGKAAKFIMDVNNGQQWPRDLGDYATGLRFGKMKR